MTQEETKIEVPIIQAEFAEHLAKYRIKKEMVDTIAENITPAHKREIGKQFKL